MMSEDRPVAVTPPGSAGRADRPSQPGWPGQLSRPGGVARPVLLAVAHGSADPAAGLVIAALTSRVQGLAPEIAVRPIFIQYGEPTLRTATAELAGAGADLTIVPLLLATGYHLNTDIAAAAAAAGARVAAPLGPASLLSEVLADRVTEALAGRPALAATAGRRGDRLAAGGRPGGAGLPARGGRLAAGGLAIVLAAAGSSDAGAAASVWLQAGLLSRRLGVPVTAAFAAAGSPSVPDAVAGLRARHGGLVAVASYLLAPGRFQRELAWSGADFVTGPLGDHPAIARLILRRYLAAVRAGQPASQAASQAASQIMPASR